HVRENRRKYAEKFARVAPLMQTALEVGLPDAGFYLWAHTSVADTDFARRLYGEQNVTVLPGSFLARESNGVNPGASYVRMVLVSFRLEDNRPIRAGSLQFYDKVPTKFGRYDRARFRRGGFRVVPPAVARRGAYIAKNVVLMPSYVNVGAYVDEGTMVDTWATVGSCAQIGKNVHLSGGVGIGGVLEPLQANPTIVEDNCFVGARSEIVEGVIVEENAVISMGVFIGASTRILDRDSGKILYGRV